MFNLISFLVLLLIILSCASKVIKTVIPKDIPPKEIPNFSYTQLKNQKSFQFNLHFKTDTPGLVEAEFDGSVILPNQEERTGTWKRMSEKVSTQIRGVGNFQYELKEGKWDIHLRGEESNILIEIERILLFSEFEIKSKASRQMVFNFKPNLIFLDPTLSKPMKGLLFINRSSLLPEKIQVTDSARTAFWEIRFFNYNRKSKISFPFTPKIIIQLTSDSKIDNKDKTLLIDRFQRLGYQSKVKTYSSSLGPILEMQLEKDIPEIQLNLIISQGKVEIYSGDWLVTNITESDTGQIKYFQFKPVQLHELIFNNQDIERAETDLTQGPEPNLELYLKAKSQSKLEGQEKLLFLLFNDEIIGYTQVRQNQLIDRIQFKEIDDIIKVTTVAAIINSGPMKQTFKFLSKSSYP